jgi:hypothetical protein
VVVLEVESLGDENSWLSILSLNYGKRYFLTQGLDVPGIPDFAVVAGHFYR